ncbi:F0F1 ATP synthase subunit alpha [bacterium]|nr:F0F1 ATP synthase subunit alpha [bacterium]
MKVNVAELSQIIQKELEAYESLLEVDEVGTVLEVGDGIARVSGLRNAMSAEMVEFENGIQGIVFNLEQETVGIVILGDYLKIKEGFQAKRLKRLLSVPVGEALLGRIVDPLGNPLDDMGPVRCEESRLVESPAPGISARKPVRTPLQTGIKAIDAMVPIGRGQRELIIGDRKTGKTAIAIDTIINQRESGVICIYVAIGQKTSTIAAVVEKLKEYDAMDYTIIVSASASANFPLQYIAPYAGCAMAEWFVNEKHKDTLIVYDDLSKHADAYRQLSLLLNRPPGREAYPGDVFYLHSRLLERSAKLSDDLGGGSMTALPIIETQEGEVSAYIPTNVISITDGQIYLLPNLFAAGIRPAIDVGISVSRVGGNAQIHAMKQVAGTLRLEMAQFRELQAFAQLGTDLDPATQRQLKRGMCLVELLKQPQFKTMKVEDQVALIYVASHGCCDMIPPGMVRQFEAEFLEYINGVYPHVISDIAQTGRLNNKTLLKEIGEEYSRKFIKDHNIVQDTEEDGCECPQKTEQQKPHDVEGGSR